MTVIDKLASRGIEYLSGVPWEGSAQEDVLGGRAYLVPLRVEFEKVMAIGDRVEFTWNAISDQNQTERILAWKGVRDGILKESSLVMSALESNAAQLTGGQVSVSVEIYRAFISKMFDTCMRGFAIHDGGVLQRSGVEPVRIVNNADLVHATMIGFQKLDEWGALKPLYKKDVVQGSVPVVLVAVLGIITVATLIVIGWFISRQVTIVAQWDLAKGACKKAVENPTPENMKLCQSLGPKTEEGWSSPVAGLNSMMTMMGIAGLVYAVSFFWPKK